MIFTIYAQTVFRIPCRQFCVKWLARLSIFIHADILSEFVVVVGADHCEHIPARIFNMHVPILLCTDFVASSWAIMDSIKRIRHLKCCGCSGQQTQVFSCGCHMASLNVTSHTLLPTTLIS